MLPDKTMADDPLSELLTGPPGAADFDVVYKALMANEAGRAFLAQFASGNRHAETEIVLAAIARLETSIRGGVAAQPAAAAQPPVDLLEIVSALERIEAELRSAAVEAADGLAAVERLQDIAFVLHERTVEPSLCDGLDAAIREIADAVTQASRERSRASRAGEMLRALAGRVRDMIAARGAPPASDVSGAPELSQAALFAVDAERAEDFGRAVAELVAALPTLADAAATAGAEAASAPASPEVAAPPPSAPEPSPSNAPANRAVADQPQQSVRNVLPDVEFDMTPRSVRAPLRSEELPPLGDEFARQAQPTQSLRSAPATPLPAASLPEDPDDLFDPLPAVAARPAEEVARLRVVPSAAAVPPSLPTATVAPTPSPAAPPAKTIPLSPVAAPTQPRAAPVESANDPLAAVRALSAEELIALFS